MRISAIRNGEVVRPALKNKQNRQSGVNFRADEPKADTVTFKSKTLKGAGIGAVVGVAALTFISGGLATPLAFGLYAAATGTAGGMLGNVLDQIDEDEKNHKKS